MTCDEDPGTANPPKSDYRTVAEGIPLQGRRIWRMIAMDLKAIWEISVRLRPATGWFSAGIIVYLAVVLRGTRERLTIVAVAVKPNLSA